MHAGELGHGWRCRDYRFIYLVPWCCDVVAARRPLDRARARGRYGASSTEWMGPSERRALRCIATEPPFINKYPSAEIVIMKYPSASTSDMGHGTCANLQRKSTEIRAHRYDRHLLYSIARRERGGLSPNDASSNTLRYGPNKTNVKSTNERWYIHNRGASLNQTPTRCHPLRSRTRLPGAPC